MKTMTFAYYCSGHGYGHATRVSAFATHLRSLQCPPAICVVSSAPKHVFSECLEKGATHRYAEIDPVIVQPVAYHVDRRKSIDVLRKFLQRKDEKLAQEMAWLTASNIDCVLSDAAFLPCLAAKAAGLPCVLITNFTFDSVYSFLCSEIKDPPNALVPVIANSLESEADTPLPLDEVSPLADELVRGYHCADVLLRLPGFIPTPSFFEEPHLPSSEWVDVASNAFKPAVLLQLKQDPTRAPLLPTLLGPEADASKSRRKVVQAPLVVRPCSQDIYTNAGRRRLLASIGVPEQLHGPTTKIVVVSFGGQTFRKPVSRHSSGSTSRTGSRPSTPSSTPRSSFESIHSAVVRNGLSVTSHSSVTTAHAHTNGKHLEVSPIHRVATPSHLWVPGAPPANKPLSPTFGPDTQYFESSILVSPPTPMVEEDDIPPEYMEEPQMLPDGSWIAIVCGVAQWGAADDDHLPENFYIAPRDVHMPDLTAVADVLLGKLGYGTVSECIDACTPFVYVPRPLFIEEHGLRRLLNMEGVGVELSREEYEAGNWAVCIELAWSKGRDAKESQRKTGLPNIRQQGIRKMAEELVSWVQDTQV